MQCRDIELKYNEFLENKLSGHDMQSFEEHCKTCEDCSYMIDDFKKNLTLLKSFPKQEVPLRLDYMVYKAIDKKAMQQFFWKKFKFHFGIGFIVGVFVLSLVWFLYYKNKEHHSIQKPVAVLQNIETIPVNKPVIVPVKPIIPVPQIAKNTVKDNNNNEINSEKVNLNEVNEQPAAIALAAKEAGDIENVLLAFADQKSKDCVYLGVDNAKISNEIKIKINDSLNNLNLKDIKINETIRNVFYRRVQRVKSINLLKKNNLIFEDNEGMLIKQENNPDFCISKKDELMLIAENKDRKLLIAFYTQCFNEGRNPNAQPEIKNEIIKCLNHSNKESKEK